MNLKTEDLQKIVDWMKSSFPDHSNCEFCLSTEGKFSLSSVVFSVQVFNKPGEEVVRGCAPILLFSCINCGNSKFFNTNILEEKGCPGINILPEKPKKKNVLSFLDYFKGKK